MRDGQLNAELRALAHRAFHLDLAAHHFDQFFGQGQADAGAFATTGRACICLVESVENVRKMLGGNPKTRITDLYLQRFLSLN